MIAGAAPVAALLPAAATGDRAALARLITHIERDGAEARELAALTAGDDPDAHIVGITGAPGAGKSTLTGALLGVLAAAGRAPAVLAVDPSSPISGGAILGDRVRMEGSAAGAFVRSMATRGQQGGLAFAVPATLRLLARAGFDPLIVETAGVGQVEVQIAGTADTTVVVTAPGWGDAVQANKAGLLEVADVLVVNKADRPGARDARRDLELMLDLGHVSGAEARAGWRPRVVMTTATTGEGISDLTEAIAAHRTAAAADGRLAARRHARVRREVTAHLERLLSERTALALASAPGRAAVEAAQAGGMSPADAAASILAAAGMSPPRA
ncbi:MAG: methylmalonyl Co-A mutase-associated GTPase MeaB [Thermoleophilia bacterium]